MKSLQAKNKAAKSFIIAWCFALTFYFFLYAGHSAPAAFGSPIFPMRIDRRVASN